MAGSSASTIQSQWPVQKSAPRVSVIIMNILVGFKPLHQMYRNECCVPTELTWSTHEGHQRNPLASIKGHHHLINSRRNVFAYIRLELRVRAYERVRALKSKHDFLKFASTKLCIGTTELIVATKRLQNNRITCTTAECSLMYCLCSCHYQLRSLYCALDYRFEC